MFDNQVKHNIYQKEKARSMSGLFLSGNHVFLILRIRLSNVINKMLS
jgi:hypothetical protein